MPLPVVTIGIAGGTGAGKSTMAQRLLEKLNQQENVAYLQHDSYYRDLSHLTHEERARNNFDHPDSLETDLMVRHIRSLKQGVAVDVPTYDFATHSRSSTTVRIEPQKIMLVEGILILTDAEVRKELDIMVFVDAAADIRLARRLERDCEERGRKVKDVLWQYRETVRPMHEKWVEPTKHEADLVVNNLNNTSLDVAVSIIANHLRSKAGLNELLTLRMP